MDENTTARKQWTSGRYDSVAYSQVQNTSTSTRFNSVAKRYRLYLQQIHFMIVNGSGPIFFHPIISPWNFIFSQNLRFRAITLVSIHQFTPNFICMYVLSTANTGYVRKSGYLPWNSFFPKSSFPCNNFSFHSPIHSQFHVWLYLQQIQLMIVNVSGPIFFHRIISPWNFIFFHCEVRFERNPVLTRFVSDIIACRSTTPTTCAVGTCTAST